MPVWLFNSLRVWLVRPCPPLLLPPNKNPGTPIARYHLALSLSLSLPLSLCAGPPDSLPVCPSAFVAFVLCLSRSISLAVSSGATICVQTKSLYTVHMQGLLPLSSSRRPWPVPQLGLGVGLPPTPLKIKKGTGLFLGYSWV